MKKSKNSQIFVRHYGLKPVKTPNGERNVPRPEHVVRQILGETTEQHTEVQIFVQLVVRFTVSK